MKTKRMLKISFSLIICAFVLIVTGLTLLEAKLQPKDIELYAKTKIEEMLPESVVSMSEVDYSLKASLVLSVKDFSIVRSDASGKKKLFSASVLKITIPISTLLMGRGNIDISGLNPQILIGPNTWKLKKSSIHSKGVAGRKDGEILLPSFLASSTFDIRANDLEVFSVVEKGEEKPFVIEKVILKKFGLATNTAFEIRSKLSSSLLGRDVNFLITNIGSFSISNYLKTGKLSIDSSYKIKNISIESETNLKRVIHGGLSANLSSTGEVIGRVTSLAERSKLNFNYNWSPSGISLTELNGELRLSDFLSFIPKNSDFDFSQSTLKFNGGAQLSNEGYLPEINFSLSSLQQVISSKRLIHALAGKLKSDFLEVELESKGLQGSLIGKLETTFSLMSDESLEERMKSYNASLTVIGMSFDQAVYQDLYTHLQPLAFKVGAGLLLPKGEIKINISESTLKGVPLKLSGLIRTKSNEVQFEGINIASDNGSAKFNQKITYFKNKAHHSKHLELTNFDINSIFNFFPRSRPSLSGLATGIYKYENKNEEVHFVDLKIGVGDFKNLDINEELLNMKDLFRNIPSVSEGNEKKFPVMSNKFSKLSVQLKSHRDFLKVKKVSLTSANGEMLLETRGNISHNKSSSLQLFLTDELGFSSKWKSMTGAERIPMLVKFKKDELFLDELFTVKQLSTGVLKNKGRARAQKLLAREKIILTKNYGIKETKKILKGVFK